MSELLSYKHILNDIKKFKRAGSKYGDDFNVYDTPAHKYFKILFYFGSESEFGSENGSGLLAPTWEVFNKNTAALESAESVFDDASATEEDFNRAFDMMYGLTTSDALKYHNYNSAWAYLKLNDENERAEKLEQFVTLLSDINTNSPWYFTKVGGITDALDRKATEEGKMELADKKLTITCLPDAFDNRISTLLELYRDITWSWIQKKEIIPANLRKFDMAIYIFETPEVNWHAAHSGLFNSKDTVIDSKNNSNESFWPSYKMIEFHDCEFNYNSIKSGWGELDNQVGVVPSYTIDITFADCYEVSYNDIMMRTIGDVILTDLINGSKNDNDYISVAQTDNASQRAQLKEKTYPYDKGFLGNMIDQAVGHLKSDVKDWVNQKLMGNIYGFSLTGTVNSVKDFLQGDIIKTGMSISQFAREQKNKRQDRRLRNADPSDKNIFSNSNSATNKSQNKIGNIFTDKTIVNNL
jgi:hypothetical protein